MPENVIFDLKFITMKAKLFLFLLFIPIVVFSQEAWRALGDDDFNRAGRGSVAKVGRTPLIAKSGSVFNFNIEKPDYEFNKFRLTVSKYSNGAWTHMPLPYFFSQTPVADVAVDNNGTPYLLLQSSPENGLPHVKKYANGSWTDLGPGLSATGSSLLNINIGTDNLPRVLVREGGVVKIKRYDGNAWVLIAEVFEFVQYPTMSLSLDNNDVPYVVSYDPSGSNYNTYVWKFNGNTWEDVGVTGFALQGASVIFDALNVPHLYFYNSLEIKKFDGTSWINIDNPVTLSGTVGWSGRLQHLLFNASNEMFVVMYVNYFHGEAGPNYLRKFNGTNWENIYSDPYWAENTYAVSGNDAYHLELFVAGRPEVSRVSESTAELLGGSTFNSENAPGYDFKICNGIPMLAYGSPAKVRMFTNGGWNLLGGETVSENQVHMVRIDSGTDGQIYLAYNNKLPSGDSKITVKKLTASGWQPVGPINFSQSANTKFDFKIGHNNQPYVFYRSGRLQTFDGLQWNMVGDIAFTGDASPSFLLDEDDIPYVAFLDASNNGRVSVKKLSGNTWQYINDGLVQGTTAQYQPRLTTDSTNQIYLGFINNSEEIHIMKLLNGQWEQLGNNPVNDASNAKQFELGVDGNNGVYVSYVENSDAFRSNIKVKKFNGSGWEFVGTPDFAAATVLSTALTFWQNDTPMVSYKSNVSNNPIHVRFFGDENALDVDVFGSVPNESGWVLAPNPARDTFSIKGPKAFDNVEIYDLTGKKVLTEKRKRENIDISLLQSGMYIVKINSDGKDHSVKLFKN